MSFQFMPAAIFGLTLYVLAAIGVLSLVAAVLYGVGRLIGLI